LHDIAYALTIGLSKEQGAMALGLLNATQAAGRILAGVIGDKVGRVNALMVTLLLSSIFCLGLWLPATTFAILLAFSGTFGLVSGGVPTLGVSVIPEIFGRSMRLPLQILTII
jgi:MFS family permease